MKTCILYLYVYTSLCIDHYLLYINSYITVGDEDHKRHLYYYFATSERNPLEDPMTIWINGGPACAGLNGLFQLVGMFFRASTMLYVLFTLI